ncbi:MAG: efflux RND transporter periplasmic adaptor subunit [Ignavibacteriae bacterium]|nr:efflux RND transporter periplasmic adaptor subunit [Ignavibacteriota bacterium]NOG98273.1 efflux RND transporter periplasmic adaptor subunit [Ignavibacteriota bacterium]
MGKSKPKKSKKKIIVFGIIGLVLLVVILLLVFGGDKERIISVQTELVKERNITQVVSATGKINPINKVELRPEVTAEIVELPVEEGDRVKKGQLLIRLKPETYIARKNSAQASLNAAKATLKIRKATLDQLEADLERIKGLYKKELASDKELEAAKAGYLQAEGSYEAQKAQISQAEASLKDANEELAKTAIYSPMNGIITQLPVELNERVLGSSFSQGTLLMTVADLSQMEARVDVDENDIVLISLGDTARVEIDAFADQKFNAIVSHIGNSAITTGLGSQNEVVNFEVRIKLIELDPKLRPGMSCDADIETDTRLSVLSVPIQSVTARMPLPEKNENKDGEDADSNDVVTEEDEESNKPKDPVEVVFTVDAGKAKMAEVKTGISDDTYIQIMEGLENEQEIISGPYRAISKELEDDVKVSVSKKRGSKRNTK